LTSSNCSYNGGKAHSNVTLAAADADEWLAQPASTGPDLRLTDAQNPDQQPNEVIK